MNRRKLGPPPSWIPTAKPPQETEAGDAADPLKNIFSASRTARLGDSEDETLLQTLNNRKQQITPATVIGELTTMLFAERRKPAPFSEILLSPSSNADVRDARNLRLVILAHNHTHSSGNTVSIARKKSAAFLSHYGVGPRRYRNTLVFVAPDPGKLEELLEELRSYLAWKSMIELPGGLEPRLVERCKAQVVKVAERREIALQEAFGWVLAPHQTEPGGPVEWEELPLSAQGKSLAESVALTLAAAGLIRMDDLGLAEDINSARAWLGDSIHSGAQLADEFARHLYLPRLIDDRILQNALHTALNAGIKPRQGSGGPKKVCSASIRLDQDDLARIAPQLLSKLLSVVSAVDLKLTLQIDALVPDTARAQLEEILTEHTNKS